VNYVETNKYVEFADNECNLWLLNSYTSAEYGPIIETTTKLLLDYGLLMCFVIYNGFNLGVSFESM
jgi:hypothetical protein